MRILTLYLPAMLFVGSAVVLYVYPAPIEYLKMQLSGMNVLSYAVFVSLLVIATVLMPITVMPIIPMASGILGPLQTALLSILGWTIGAMIAFLLARSLGRPILEQFVSFERVDRLIEQLPKRSRFIFIVVVRLTTPVDIASYALGLSRSIGFFEYTVATLIGVTWFSFAFSYLGDALVTGNTILLFELGLISLAIFLGGWYYLKRPRTQSEPEERV